MEQAIETVGLRRVFGEVAAVESLDLTVEPGTFFGFLGPNGAGKSTTIKMLTGLLAPSAGTARILGHDVVTESVEAKRLIGVVPEESALFERLTGPDNLALGDGLGLLAGFDVPLAIEDVPLLFFLGREVFELELVEPDEESRVRLGLLET